MLQSHNFFLFSLLISTMLVFSAFPFPSQSRYNPPCHYMIFLILFCLDRFYTPWNMPNQHAHTHLLSSECLCLPYSSYPMTKLISCWLPLSHTSVMTLATCQQLYLMGRSQLMTLFRPPHFIKLPETQCCEKSILSTCMDGPSVQILFICYRFCLIAHWCHVNNRPAYIHFLSKLFLSGEWCVLDKIK